MMPSSFDAPDASGSPTAPDPTGPRIAVAVLAVGAALFGLLARCRAVEGAEGTAAPAPAPIEAPIEVHGAPGPAGS
jgi:hypothetical protein